HAEAIASLCAGMPPESEMEDIFRNRSDWWNGWRQSLDLSWGEEEDATLECFAVRAFSSGHPSLLGNLLVCFAISAGDHFKYLPLVERWILNNDELAGSESGLQCLMGLGLVLLSIMQPRRAWHVYRKANTLLQLNGIHRECNRSKKIDSIFWQLFHADRWVSLIVGLPYSVSENLCNLKIPPVDAIPPATFHYRHFAVLTGRVIDCLQSINGLSLSTVTHIQEQMDRITSQLPPGYIDLSQTITCSDDTEKYMRLMRISHVHQLKSLLHLPLFLRQDGDEDVREYSRKACVASSRVLLEAYLQIHAGSLFVNGITANLESFAAFTSAVILFFHLLGYGQSSFSKYQQRSSNESTVRNDEQLIQRALEALKNGSTGRSALLCHCCYTALEALVTSTRALTEGGVRNVVLPFFGTVSVNR
ncbi:uncharacterized protein K452DRAFT_210542, partial [Aplosporella prunicola CBS 121167]